MYTSHWHKPDLFLYNVLCLKLVLSFNRCTTAVHTILNQRDIANYSPISFTLDWGKAEFQAPKLCWRPSGKETTETWGWLTVVRKWNGLFLATVHFVFWRQRYKQWVTLKSSCSHYFPYVQASGGIPAAILGFSVPHGSGAITVHDVLSESEGEQHVYLPLVSVGRKAVGKGHWCPLINF